MYTATTSNKGPQLSPAIAAINNTQQVPSLKPLNTPPVTAKVPITNSSIYEDFVSLPIRFQRKLISQEEMEYIEVKHHKIVQLNVLATLILSV